MACNLLPTSLSHRSCHKDEIKGWIFIKTSVHGSSNFSGCAFDKASFAARSASSFPLISLWVGSQQNVTNLPLDNIFWHACKTLFTRGFLLSWHIYIYIYTYNTYIHTTPHIHTTPTSTTTAVFFLLTVNIGRPIYMCVCVFTVSRKKYFAICIDLLHMWTGYEDKLAVIHIHRNGKYK